MSINPTCCTTGLVLSSDHNGIRPLKERLMSDLEVQLNAQGQDVQAAALIDIWELTSAPLDSDSTLPLKEGLPVDLGVQQVTHSSGGCAASRCGQQWRSCFGDMLLLQLCDHWMPEEAKLLTQLVQEHGTNKWKCFAGQLSGNTPASWHILQGPWAHRD